MKIKKILMSLTAAVTALTAGLQSTVFAYAAPFSTKYISDIKSIRCENADEARHLFKLEGYTMLETNVNPTLENAVYIGYKTSANINDAITGLKFMNMKGQYSFSQYDEVLNDFRNEVNSHIEGLVPAIEAFRENYENGKDCAVQAFTIMNSIYDPIADSKMGDFLMNCELDADNREPLVNAMMKGNAGIVQAIERYLALGAAEDSGSWFERLEDTSQAELLSEYMDDYPTISKASNAIAQDYGTEAILIKGMLWNDLYNALQAVENQMTKQDDGTYDITEIFSDIPENYLAEGEDFTVSDELALSDRLVASGQMVTVYEILSEYEYEDESLLDFFNRPADEVTLEELYPLVSVMTDAQRGTLSSTGLVDLIIQADAPDDWEAEQKELFENYSKAYDDTVSLYFDVNQHIFDDGIAMTSAATQRDIANVSFLDAFRHNSGNDSEWDNWARVRIFGIVAAASAGATAVLAIGQTKCKNISADIQNKLRKSILQMYDDDYNIHNMTSIAPDVDDLDDSFEEEAEEVLVAPANSNSKLLPFENFTFKFFTNVLRAFEFTCALICLVSTICTLVSAVSMLWKSAVYTEIPAMICDAWEGETFSDYVFYDAVQGLNQDDMQYADMNGYDQSTYFLNANQGWLVLYYTKDKRIGNPLKELTLQTGNSKMPLGFEAATIFGNGAAVNLTSKEFTGQKEDPQIYLFYKRSATGFTGTVATTGNYVVTGAIGLLAGGLIGGLIGSKRRKKSAGTPAAA